MCDETNVFQKNSGDVTAVQRHVAGIELLSADKLAAADTNGDGKVDIADATLLQKYLARCNVMLGNTNS